MIRSHRLLLAVCVALCAAGGCAGPRGGAEVRSTPARPVWSAEATRATLRGLNSAAARLERETQQPAEGAQAGRVADYLAQRLRRYGVQPAVEGYRLHYGAPGAARLPLLVGFVAGRDPLDKGAVVVYAPLSAARAAAGRPSLRGAALLELARVYASLGWYYRYPARTLVFVMPLMPAQENHGAAVAAYLQQPVWPLEHTEAVLVLGAPQASAAAWQAAGLPAAIPVDVLAAPAAEENPVAAVHAFAREAYAWLLPYVGASPDARP